MSAVVNHKRVPRIVGRGHDLTIDEVSRQISSGRLRSLAQFIEQNLRADKADVRHGNIPASHTRIANKCSTGTIDTYGNHRICASLTEDSYLYAHVRFKRLVSSIRDRFDSLEV